MSPSVIAVAKVAKAFGLSAVVAATPKLLASFATGCPRVAETLGEFRYDASKPLCERQPQPAAYQLNTPVLCPNDSVSIPASFSMRRNRLQSGRSLSCFARAT